MNKKALKMENGGEEIKDGNNNENLHAVFENKLRDIIQPESPNSQTNIFTKFHNKI